MGGHLASSLHQIKPCEKKMNLFKNPSSQIRQLRFPEEFRIHDSQWDNDWILSIDKLCEEILNISNNTEAEEAVHVETKTDKEDLYINLGTGLFRMQKSMVDPETHKVPDQYSRVMRHLQSVFDVLEENGVLIKDHTGEEWVDGRNISAIAFQPIVGYSKELVLETIRPSIFVGNNHIQQGQVIVGTPPGKEDLI